MIINTVVDSYRVFIDTVSVSVSGRLPSVQSVCASVHQFICAAKCESDSSSHTALCFCDTSYAKCSPARSRSARPVLLLSTVR